ncbi:MAG: outer membrane beta-barrel protein [Bacteroidia bacterium]|nr:outer membrane beta-barrel protein [Bacteroidia bacterium]
MSKYWLSLIGSVILFIAPLGAQNLSIGIGAGPHSVTRRYAVEEEDDDGVDIEKERGAGLFVGPSVLFGVNDNVRVSVDLLLSWGRDSDEDKEEYTFGSIQTKKVSKYTYNEIFLNVPIMGRYRYSLGNVALEGGTGLQLNYWVSARSKSETTITERNIRTGVETVRREADETDILEDNDDVNRVSLSIPLIVGAAFEVGGGELGLYLRWDPMLTNLYDDDDFRLTRTTLGLMAAYYFKVGR